MEAGPRTRSTEPPGVRGASGEPPMGLAEPGEPRGRRPRLRGSRACGLRGRPWGSGKPPTRPGESGARHGVGGRRGAAEACRTRLARPPGPRPRPISGRCSCQPRLRVWRGHLIQRPRTAPGGRLASAAGGPRPRAAGPRAGPGARRHHGMATRHAARRVRGVRRPVSQHVAVTSGGLCSSTGGSPLPLRRDTISALRGKADHPSNMPRRPLKAPELGGLPRPTGLPRGHPTRPSSCKHPPGWATQRASSPTRLGNSKGREHPCASVDVERTTRLHQGRKRTSGAKKREGLQSQRREINRERARGTLENGTAPLGAATVVPVSPPFGMPLCVSNQGETAFPPCLCRPTRLNANPLIAQIGQCCEAYIQMKCLRTRVSYNVCCYRGWVCKLKSHAPSAPRSRHGWQPPARTALSGSCHRLMTKSNPCKANRRRTLSNFSPQPSSKPSSLASAQSHPTSVPRPAHQVR